MSPTTVATEPELKVNRVLFTRDEYHRIAASGVLDDRRVELIRGEIVEMSPMGSSHMWVLNRLNAFFSTLYQTRQAISSNQCPIAASGISEPQPDLCLVSLDCERRQEIPTAADIFLIIEVSDSSLESDRRLNGPLYAEAGVAEYWIANIADRCLEIHRDPDPAHAVYRQRLIVRGQEPIAPLAFPEMTILPDRVFGKEADQ
ncbi:MAG: Uma2 family endonuclease [Sumerlaeia bacterium]